jgi:hypothetical protein
VDYKGDVHDGSPMFAMGEDFEYEGLCFPVEILEHQPQRRRTNKNIPEVRDLQ